MVAGSLMKLSCTSENKTKRLKWRHIGREPWPSGYGRRLTFQRSWVQILAPYTGWKFFHIYLLKKFVMFVWKDRKKRKRGQRWPIFLKKWRRILLWTSVLSGTEILSLQQNFEPTFGQIFKVRNGQHFNLLWIFVCGRRPKDLVIT